MAQKTPVTRSNLPNPWLPYLPLTQLEKGKINLFCFPYAGGGASLFRSWLNAFPEKITIHPVQLPGREKRFKEKPYTSIEALIPDLVCALEPYLESPFAFFGYSMGGLLSYELIRYLRRHAASLPQHLFLAAFPHPRYKAKNHISLYQLPDEEFTQLLPRQQNNVFPDLLEKQANREVFLPLLRADYALVDTYLYVPEEPLDCPITVFGGLHDTTIQQQLLEQWESYTQSGFSLHMLDGDHFFLHDCASDLIHLISKSLQG